MTDVEHELVHENQRLRHRAAELADLARRAVVAAIDEQDRAHGAHEPWLDDALASIDEDLPDLI